MSTPIIVSRVRALLYKQGYQGFTKEQILSAATTLGVNVKDPTPEESKSVVEHIIKTATQLTKTPIEIDLTQLSTLNDVAKSLLETTKTEMIRSESHSMGVILSESDITQIASNINSQATETDELFTEIREAISAYIQYQKQSSQAKIQTLFADINLEQRQANQEISQALSTGLNNFARDLEVSRHSFKSSVRASLKLLAVPQE